MRWVLRIDDKQWEWIAGLMMLGVESKLHFTIFLLFLSAWACFSPLVALSPLEHTAVTEWKGKIGPPALSPQPAGYYSPPSAQDLNLLLLQKQQRWVFSAGSGNFPITYCTWLCEQAGFLMSAHFSCFTTGNFIFRAESFSFPVATK